MRFVIYCKNCRAQLTAETKSHSENFCSPKCFYEYLDQHYGRAYNILCRIVKVMVVLAMIVLNLLFYNASGGVISFDIIFMSLGFALILYHYSYRFFSGLFMLVIRIYYLITGKD